MNSEIRPIRLVQWTTGKVACASIKAILERPNLELVGLYAFSESKVGKDVGELAGLGRDIGVKATNDLDALLALKPDCVVYMPLHPDVEQMATILRAGVNIATTASFLTGRGYGQASRETLQAAAEAGSASLFGSGINPGWVDNLVCTATSMCQEVNQIRVVESFNIGLWAEDANQDALGWGRPAGDTGHTQAIEQATLPFGDAVEAVAHALNHPLDDIRCEVEFAHATEDLDVPGRDVKAGTVAGILARWLGISDGLPVIDLTAQWTVAEEITPAWDIAMAYKIDVFGSPKIGMRVEVLPEDMSLPMDELVLTGHIMTAAPVVNAIPQVVAAPPGIVTYADIKPVTSVIRPKPVKTEPTPEVAVEDAPAPAANGAVTAESLVGTWTVTIAAPTGPQATKLDLRLDNGVLCGEQSADGNSSAITDVKLDGNQLTWINRVAKPMKLKVKFLATVEGHRMSGKVKPGPLGRFSFTAEKVAA